MIKHLTGRTQEEIEKQERSLFSGRLVREMSYDELAEMVHIISPIWNNRASIQRDTIRKAQRQAAKAGFYKGQTVGWYRNGSKNLGTVIRLNPTCASVKDTNGYKWHISYRSLEKL